MEIPHPEHNLRNSVKKLTCSKLKCYTTLIRSETQAPQREVSHQKLSQASPLMSHSTFAPSLTAAMIFRRIGSHDPFRKRGFQTSFANGREKKNWSRFRVVLTKEIQGGNINTSRQQSDYSTYSSTYIWRGLFSEFYGIVSKV